MIYSTSTALLSCDHHQCQAVGLCIVLEELEDEDHRTPVHMAIIHRCAPLYICRHILKLEIQGETGSIYNEGLYYYRKDGSKFTYCRTVSIQISHKDPST